MRDALGSLHNLEQLLKSIRVGPKALSAVIPDVHASCAPLLGAVRELLGALREHLDDRAATDALEAFIAPRVGALEEALATARRRPINAKNRLALEDVVTEVARELDAARALIDLLEAALGGAGVRVDLLDLVRSAARPPDRTEAGTRRSVEATLTAPARNVEVLVNPRLAIWLLGIGVQLMAAGDEPTLPHIVVVTTNSGCGLRVQRGPGTGETLSFPVHPLIAPTFVCAETAARLDGARCERAGDKSYCAILWPTAGS